MWTSKVTQTIKRSWRTVLVVTLLGIGLPTAVIRFVSWVSFGYLAVDPALATRWSDLPTGRVLFGGFLTFVVAVVASFLIAAAWAAATWVVTVEANGERESVGRPLRFGWSRAASAGGWTILVGVIVALGTLCFVLPGLYLAFALSCSARS